MTIKRVQRACAIRGIWFDGIRRWQNNVIGYGYSVNIPTGGFRQADTLDGLYKAIKELPKIES